MTMSNLRSKGTYNIGDGVRLEFELRNLDGVLVDTTPVTVLLEHEDGQRATPGAVAHPGVGLWNTSFLPPRKGRWYYRWVAEGDYAAVEEGYFDVLGSRFTD